MLNSMVFGLIFSIQGNVVDYWVYLDNSCFERKWGRFFLVCQVKICIFIFSPEMVPYWGNSIFKGRVLWVFLGYFMWHLSDIDDWVYIFEKEKLVQNNKLFIARLPFSIFNIEWSSICQNFSLNVWKTNYKLLF